jgi:hypothetical protein
MDVTSDSCSPAPTAAAREPTVAAGSAKEGDMITNEMAQYRIEETIQRSEARRRASETRARRGAGRASKLRRLGTAISAVALWPVRH